MTEIQTLENGYQMSRESVAALREHPAVFSESVLGITPYAEQAEILEKVCRDREWVSWRSGHGPGKSTGLAVVVLCWLYFFTNARVICTAPKRDQIFDILWNETARILQRPECLIASDFIWEKTRIHLRGREQQCWAVARTSRSPEAMGGQHAENILYIFDEASGIRNEVFEAAEGSMTTHEAVMLLAGNPTQRSGYFADSHHADRSRWHKIHTPVENHPNVIPGYAPKLAKKWGINSDVYRVRVLGEFPTGDPNTFITLDRVEAAVNRDAWPEGPMEIGVDVARFGDDRTIILGRQGLHVFEHHVRLARSSVPEVTGNVLKLTRELRDQVSYEGQVRVKVDDASMGGGVTDELRLVAEEKGMQIVPCNFGGAGDDEYDDEATVMWARLRDLIDEIQLPDIDDLVAEVSMRRYGIRPNGKMRMEPKDEFKKRHGASPDYADALVLLFADGAARVSGGFIITESTNEHM